MSNELVAQNETALAAPGMFDSLEEMERSLKIAERLSQSNILPETFKGKAGDVLIALDMAQRLRMNPLMVMQGIVIVHGRPTFSGQFYGALITAGGRQILIFLIFLRSRYFRRRKVIFTAGSHIRRRYTHRF